MSIAPLVFQGISKYSADFQSIVDRAVKLAQLPMKALQNQQANIIQEKLSASNLSTAVAALTTSVQTLGEVGANKGLTPRSTDSAKVSVTLTGVAQPAYYRITDITSVAATASETSLRSYGANDAVSASGILTLAVGDQAYAVDVTGNNTLEGVRDAINALPNTGVSATVITAEGGSYLSVSATTTGKNAISLMDYPPPSGAVSGAITITAGVNDQLTITTDAGTDTITLANTDATLDDIVQDINGKSTHATASIEVDGGGNSRLVIRSKTAGGGAAAAVSGNAVTAGGNQLGLSGAALLTATNPGANTEFKLNGIAVTNRGMIVSGLVAGVTFQIGGTTSGAETVGITLSSDRSHVSTALQDLVTKYNAVAEQVNAQIGPNAGLLSGNSIIRDVRGAMLMLVNYSGGTGQVQSLAALGIEMDNTGQMSFNSSTFAMLSDSQITDAFSFLGSANSGFGALRSRFSQISDPVTGTIKAQLDSFAASDKRINDQIAAMTDRITTMQTALQAKLQAADAVLASLESQQNMLTASIQSLNYTSFGKAQGSN